MVGHDILSLYLILPDIYQDYFNGLCYREVILPPNQHKVEIFLIAKG